jgi:hypothetical protein
MNLFRVEPFAREEARYGPFFDLISSRTHIGLRFSYAGKMMKIKESMKGHTERRSPDGGGDGSCVCLTEKQSPGSRRRHSRNFLTLSRTLALESLG